MTGSNLDLLEQVEKLLLPRVSSLGLSIIDHQESESFDDADVTLVSGDVRVRIFRERGIVFLDLASAHSPHEWFDSAVVFDYLGLSQDGGFHSQDVRMVLEGVASFLTTFWAQISQGFATPQVADTNKSLKALREAQAARRFGP